MKYGKVTEYSLDKFGWMYVNTHNFKDESPIIGIGKKMEDAYEDACHNIEDYELTGYRLNGENIDIAEGEKSVGLPFYPCTEDAFFSVKVMDAYELTTDFVNAKPEDLVLVRIAGEDGVDSEWDNFIVATFREYSIMESLRNSKKLGFIEVREGAFLADSECMEAEQEDFDDEDPCKQTDFSEYGYWVTTDNGEEPEGYDSIRDVLQYMRELDEN